MISARTFYKIAIPSFSASAIAFGFGFILFYIKAILDVLDPESSSLLFFIHVNLCTDFLILAFLSFLIVLYLKKEKKGGMPHGKDRTVSR